MAGTITGLYKNASFSFCRVAGCPSSRLANTHTTDKAKQELVRLVQFKRNGGLSNFQPDTGVKFPHGVSLCFSRCLANGRRHCWNREQSNSLVLPFDTVPCPVCFPGCVGTITEAEAAQTRLHLIRCITLPLGVAVFEPRDWIRTFTSVSK